MYIGIKIVCKHCHADQNVAIQHMKSGCEPLDETVTCTECKREFDMPVAGRIVVGVAIPVA